MTSPEHAPRYSSCVRSANMWPTGLARGVQVLIVMLRWPRILDQPAEPVPVTDALIRAGDGGPQRSRTAVEGRGSDAPGRGCSARCREERGRGAVRCGSGASPGIRSGRADAGRRPVAGVDVSIRECAGSGCLALRGEFDIADTAAAAGGHAGAVAAAQQSPLAVSAATRPGTRVLGKGAS